MSSATEVFAALKARAAAQITSLPLYWQDERNVLPPTPAPFVYFEFSTDRARHAAFGGGRGSNLHRVAGELIGYVFWRRGAGLDVGLGYGETVAAVFRSWRSNEVSCSVATVQPLGEGAALVPPGLSNAAGNYSCVAVIVALHFDQIG